LMFWTTKFKISNNVLNILNNSLKYHELLIVTAMTTNSNKYILIVTALTANSNKYILIFTAMTTNSNKYILIVTAMTKFLVT